MSDGRASGGAICLLRLLKLETALWGGFIINMQLVEEAGS
jgi:hypothetical protein